MINCFYVDDIMCDFIDEIFAIYFKPRTLLKDYIKEIY